MAQICFTLKIIPRIGGAEKVKSQATMPPFSLMAVSIQGRKAETLVKTVNPSWLQLCPSLLLAIPRREWAPSSFSTVNGPPLSPCIRVAIDPMELMTISNLARPCPSAHNQVLMHLVR